jgi:hypothetical protein
MNFTLNLALIWRYGAVAAAATTVLTEIVVNTLFCRRCRQEGIPIPLRDLLLVLGTWLLLAAVCIIV